ncbi:MAG: M14 family zinc carboxypeptidase, partial [Gemmatimonadota bacterium]
MYQPRLLAILSLLTVPAAAQHSFSETGRTYDPSVPTPRQVLGYDLGQRFTTHRAMTRYIERVAAASQRVKVDTVARSFEGREMFILTITSEVNHQRLERIRADARRAADPRGATQAEIDLVVGRLPAIVWLAHSVHGGEASGVEAGLALLYQLAAGTDRETIMALDSTVVLIDPSQNPDGRERHTHDVERMWSAMSLPSEPGALNNAGSWPGPRTSHYSFDLNRDWFIHSHPETRGRVSTYLRWMPHVAVDLHEQGSSASFYFAPPREPDNMNNPRHLFKWFDIFAAAHGAEFDRHGWSYFRREGYDSFYPGYGEGWPMLTGAIGMLFESASSSGGGIRRNDGTLRTLRQAAWEHYTAEWATVRTSARRRTELVSDFAKSRRDAISI